MEANKKRMAMAVAGLSTGIRIGLVLFLFLSVLTHAANIHID
jgi:hypothetical protein